MACFPKIDQPCPLGIDAQRRIRGHCAHCSKHVQSLDGMDAVARAAYLRAATGPVCVSYRVPRAAILGLGAVLVLSSVAPGHAADPVGAGVSVDVPATPAEPRKDDEPVMLMGGVTDPSAAADAMDADDDVPELPVMHEPADG